ncbi:MAG: hypothetical protein CL678_03780 [Bdellovibrionaceae bacterium]|nr:hypothetical protein [Pseudobdellovibrionaceae bacterium]
MPFFLIRRGMTQYEDLSPQQKEVVDSWGQGLAVQAGAGSGKTTTLVIKCETLLKRKPDARFAAVSFTERSASDLKEKLSDRIHLGGPDFAGHWVKTIHGLCASVIRDFPTEAGFDGEETVMAEAESLELWERCVQRLWWDNPPEEVERAVDFLLKRETRSSFLDLLKRSKDLASFGLIEYLNRNSDEQALQKVLSYLFEHYNRLKFRRGTIDFQDLEQGADRALSYSHVQKHYQQRFDLVMIDEFQDTNPLQARLLWNFVKNDQSNLCVVGDPKQSIYRFRDADVSVFDDLCSRLPVKKSLSWNFRSRPEIIHYVNGICEKIFPYSKMNYEPLEPKKSSTDEPAIIELNITDPKEFAGWVQSERAKGARLEDMAILLRKIRGNENWIKALIESGVPIAISSGGLFWEDPRVRELVSFLKWWSQPENELSGAVFLRAPWVPVTDDWIDEQRKLDKNLWDSFFELEIPLAKRLSKFLNQPVRPSELLWSFLEEGQEEELGTAVLGLWHRAEESSSRGLDFVMNVSEMENAVQKSLREREVPPPHNEGQLTIMTLHGSKGLEFPRVILLDLKGKTKAPNSPLLYWDRNDGAYLAGRDDLGARLKKDSVENLWKDRELLHVRAESMRLFYVALTRPQNQLILVKTENEKLEKEYEKPEKIFESDHWRGWIDLAGDSKIIQKEEVRNENFEQNPQTEEVFCLNKINSYQKERPRHSVTEWNILSLCERKYVWKTIVSRAPQKKVQVRDSSSSSSSINFQELGTDVHAAFENEDRESSFIFLKKKWKNILPWDDLLEWSNQSQWFSENFIQTWNELPFEVPVTSGKAQVLVGAIDRVVESKDAFYILDYKVTLKSKSAEALIEAYQAQLQLYCWALSQLLFDSPKKIKAFLIQIDQSGVREIEVPVSESPNIHPFKIASRINELIAAPEKHQATPSAHCLVCEYSSFCDRAALC